jgi:DNA (cytosine-5)-methyltransferase 1
MIVAHALRADGFDASEDGTGRGVPLVPVTTGTLVSVEGKHGQGTGRFARTPENGHIIPVLVDPAPVAFSAKDHGADASGETAPTLRAMERAATACGDSQMAIAFTERTRADGRNLETQDELAYALTNPNGGGGAYSRKLMTGAMAVRRLTVRECERLQGFPDDYTLVPYRGKPAADGPRYKALGNSFAVPVIRWIGERIQACRARILHGPNYKIAG